MLLKAVVTQKDTEMKPMLCDSLTQKCINRNEWYKFFVRWILSIWGKEEFSGTIQTMMYDLLWNVISNNHEQWKFPIRSFSVLECQYFRKKSCLKKKMSLIFIRNQTTGVELRKNKQPMKNKYTTNTQTNLSMKTKITNWQDQSLQMHMGNNFPSNKKLKRTIDLNF